MTVRGTRIELIRMKRGLTLRELGEMADVTASCLSAIERGITCPRPQTAKRLCEALNMEFDDLFLIVEEEATRA